MHEPHDPDRTSPSGLVRFVEDRARLLLALILSLALLLRILALLSLKQSVYYDFLLWDERFYHVWAVQIATGTYESTAVYEFAPLFAYLTAFVYRLFSPDVLYVRIMNILFGTASCFLVYLIGKESANRATGLASAAIAALCEPLIFYSIVPLKASLSVLLFALTIWLLAATLNRHSPVKVLLLGVSIGLMMNVRPHAGLIIPVLPLMLILSAWKRTHSIRPILGAFILYSVGLLVSLSPFVLRNAIVAHEPVLTTSQAGFNFYQANYVHDPAPYYSPMPFASTSPFEQGTQFTIEASRRTGRKLTPQEASSYWTGESLKMIREHPAAFLRKLCLKAVVLFQDFQPENHYHIGFLSRFVGFFKIPFFSFAIIMPLGMAGMLVTARRSRTSLDLASVFFVYGLGMVVFFTAARYRLPLMTILIPMTVMGVKHFASSVVHRHRKEAVSYLTAVFLFVVLELLPLPGKNDMTAYYNTHAIALNALGRTGEAVPYWEASSGMNGRYSDFADLSLAGANLMGKRIEEGLSCLERVRDDSFAAAYKYDILGDILLYRGKVREALAAYERSLEINSGQRNTLSKLVKIYWRTDREKALKAFERLEYISSFYDSSETRRTIDASKTRNNP